MPLVAETTLGTFTSQFVEVSFGSVSPAFDKLDAYVNLTPLRGARTTWRLYATVGGITTLVSETGPLPSAQGSSRIIASMDISSSPSGISADVYELRGVVIDPLTSGPVNVLAGLVGYDSKINDSPPDETVTSSGPLLFGVPTSFGVLNIFHTDFEATIDLSAALSLSASTWTLYAIITGLGGTLRVPVFSNQYAPSSGSAQQALVIKTSTIGATSYELTGVGTNTDLGEFGTPIVSTTFRGYCEVVDIVTGGGGGPPTGPAGGDLGATYPNPNVVGLQTRPISPAAPLLNDVLEWNGVAWAPTPLAGGPPSGPAGGYLGGTYPNPTIVASPTLIFQPGGVASGSIYTTWASLYAAFLLTVGEVTIAIDDSLGAPTAPVAVYDWQGRATITSLVQKQTASPTPLTLADGAVFKDLRALTGIIQLNIGSVATPAFQFTTARVFTMSFGAVIRNTGAAPAIRRSAAGLLVVLMSENSTYDNSPANGAFVDQAVAGAQTVLYTITGSGWTTDNVVTGVAGASLIEQFDASLGNLPTNPGFAGTTNLFVLDTAAFVGYDAANISPAPATLAASSYVQTAIDAHRSPQRTVAANYVVDSAGFDGTLFSNSAGINLTLPLAASWSGREITFKDITAAIGVVFNLVPVGGNLVDGIAGPSAFSVPKGSVTVKSDGINTWWVI